MAYIDSVKPWFETGDYPTQAQFYQWMAWLRWKDEMLGITDVNGLQVILNNIASIDVLKALLRAEIDVSDSLDYGVTAGDAITGIIIISPTDCTIKIGTQWGLGDIADSIAVTANKPEPVTLLIYGNGFTIKFEGFVPGSKLIILKNPK